MSMSPAGVTGGMDEEAVIQAEIELELQNINIDDVADDVVDIVEAEVEADQILEEGTPGELEEYIRRIQEQTSNFERELEECDELILHTDRPRDKGTSDALIPYEDFSLLSQLAQQSGCDIERYKQKILLDLEQDEDILHDDLADLIEADTVVLKPIEGQGHQAPKEDIDGVDTAVSAENKNRPPETDGSLPIAIERAMEQGVDPVEVPVSQDLVPVDSRAGIQQMLRDQLIRLENTYRERTEKIKKEEAFKRNEEEVKQRRIEEERQWKKQEIEREEKKLKEEREAAEKQIRKEEEEAERQIAEQMKKFKEEMRALEAETERQKQELARARMDEEIRQLDRQHHSACLIQRHYRGYRTRKQYLPGLEEKREERRRKKEELRIKEVEKEMKERERKKSEEEEQKKLKIEEEKRQKEEEKRRKEEEKRLKEEEKRRKKEEEKQQKEEEKRRKEEEKQRLEEEKRRKKEEEKRTKEEEAERKREEKRQKEEEEKRRKEEEKLKKEEEKRKKEEEKRRKEEEEKQLKEKKEKEAEEQRLKEEENRKREEQKQLKEKDTHIKTEKGMESKTGIDAQLKTDSQTTVDVNSEAKLINGIHDTDNVKDKKEDKITEKDKMRAVTEPVSKSGELEKISANAKRTASEEKPNYTGINPEKTPRTSRTPRPPASPKKKQPDVNIKDVQKSGKKDQINSGQAQSADCLPEPLEARRLAFITECLPWSKISNEPWKLKGVTSRKPLRRPSSAKKLSPLTDDIILKAARVASLKQVTTVELCDLPGYSMSPLGQCWGLKYLSMTRCNLRLLEGLQQCRQLLYINIQENKLEYVDLKDIGSLQVLDMSHNCLSSIHGLDNCTNLRWLDISHNNITRLGGLETLRRLHTLKLSHNQLISTAGLSDTPTIQVLDVSANHLPAVDDLEKLCLLLSLNASSNTILKVPCLKNQVLLHEVLLVDNSITSFDEVAKFWLPLLQKIVVSQNSIVELGNLQNCLTLREFDISNNQLVDADVLKKCIENSVYLEQLNLEENPLLEEVDNSFHDQLHKLLPRLQSGRPTGSKSPAVKPRNSFEAMCLSQAQVYKDMFTQLEQQIRLQKENSSSDLAHKCDSYFKFCDKTFQIGVEHRYAHEYGEVTVTIPTAPITPRSGRPNSGRKIVPKGDTFTNPKDLFEKALQSSDKTSVVSNTSVMSSDNALKKTNTVSTLSAYSNPKDLFEQALKSSATNANSSTCADQSSGQVQDGTFVKDEVLVNGVLHEKTHQKSVDHRSAAAIVIQAAWRGWLVRHEISQQTKIWLAAITVQAAWRGYRVRNWYRAMLEERRKIENIDPELVEKLHKAATVIQAAWRGYWLRSRLLAALEYARFEEKEDEDEMNLNGEEFDLDKFMDFKEDLLENEWRPPSTPEIPANHPVLRKPPSGRPKVPPISTGERPPSNPRRAWKNLESPMSDIQNPLGRIPRPPSSVGSGVDTHRTGISKKEEKLSEEWGFKDSSTAHLMMQRAKKMKYNAERKKKISKLDPKQRLRLFQKLQEVAHIDQHVHVPQRKTLPRKEYFKARQDEIVRKEQEKQEEYHTRASRIYEWLHMPVNNYPVTDSVINQGLNQGHRYASESNLPDVQAGRRVQLTSGPGSLELQSVDSMSATSDQRRRFSAGSGSSVTNKLPPIQSSSAPTVKVKERMSWRSAKVNQSAGWGGGKKRGDRH